MLRGLFPRSQEDKSALKSRPGFDYIVKKDGFDDQYGHIPVQPDDNPREWGSNSFSILPSFGGARASAGCGVTVWLPRAAVVLPR